jgi:lipopolysaccharide transport system permease protein
VTVVARTEPVLDVSGPSTSLPDLLRGVWQARELISTLARREFFARYRRATLGVVWAVVLPLLQALVLAIVFTRVAHLHLPVNPFVFVFSGMAAWSFFSTALGSASTSVVDNSQLASKIYFPRLALPLVSVASASYVAVVNAVIVVVATFVVGVTPSPRLLLIVPGLALLLLVTAFAATLLAGLHVYFRDIRYLVQATLLLAFYLTPVFYPLEAAPTALRRAVEINPLTGVIEIYRAATVGADHNWGISVAITLAWLVCLGAGALYVHCRFDRVFADLL